MVRRLHGKSKDMEFRSGRDSKGINKGDITRWWYGKEWVDFEAGGIRRGMVKEWSPGMVRIEGDSTRVDSTKKAPWYKRPFRFLSRTKSDSGGTP
jgi:hypothetical protein